MLFGKLPFVKLGFNCFTKVIIFIFLKSRVGERKRDVGEREGECSICCFMPHMPCLDQAKAKIQELYLDLPKRALHRLLASIHSFINEKAAGTQTSTPSWMQASQAAG